MAHVDMTPTCAVLVVPVPFPGIGHTDPARIEDFSRVLEIALDRRRGCDIPAGAIECRYRGCAGALHIDGRRDEPVTRQVPERASR